MAKKKKDTRSTQQNYVRCDLRYPMFQKQLSELLLPELTEVLNSITKIQQMNWQQVWETSSKGAGKRGLNWEPLGQQTADGHQIASIRISGKSRARVCRNGDWMQFISVHPDHDSAYK